MVSEVGIRARLVETEDRLGSLGLQIAPLQKQVSSGADGWQKALEVLAECYKTRRDLEVQRESLFWVLSQEQMEARANLAR
jgi:hypothetical protein